MAWGGPASGNVYVSNCTVVTVGVKHIACGRWERLPTIQNRNLCTEWRSGATRTLEDHYSLLPIWGQQLAANIVPTWVEASDQRDCGYGE
jgi:hypothetical protein